MNSCSYSPDKIFGIDISSACELHDRGYKGIWGMEKTPWVIAKKRAIDTRLRDDIFKLTNSKFIANIYYFAVRLFGWSSLHG